MANLSFLSRKMKYGLVLLGAMVGSMLPSLHEELSATVTQYPTARPLTKIQAAPVPYTQIQADPWGVLGKDLQDRLLLKAKALLESVEPSDSIDQAAKALIRRAVLGYGAHHQKEPLITLGFDEVGPWLDVKQWLAEKQQFYVSHYYAFVNLMKDNYRIYVHKDWMDNHNPYPGITQHLSRIYNTFAANGQEARIANSDLDAYLNTNQQALRNSFGFLSVSIYMRDLYKIEIEAIAKAALEQEYASITDDTARAAKINSVLDRGLTNLIAAKEAEDKQSGWKLRLDYLKLQLPMRDAAMDVAKSERGR